MWQRKRVALVGLGKSNMAVGRYLVKNGAEVTGFDQKPSSQMGDRVKEAKRLGMELITGASYLDALRGFEVIFLTPGIKKSLPQIKRAEAEGSVLSSEINLVFDLCRAPIAGVTGSAGKTTTVSLLGAILKQSPDRPVFLGGNIGNPLIEVIEDVPPTAVVVLELSSFQLQLLRKSPEVGAVLNISENHLDVHDSMEEYVLAKENVFRYGVPGSWAVFNADDPRTMRMAERAPHNVALYSRTGPVETGAFLQDDRVIFRRDGVEYDCGSVTERLIPGAHNVDNILAATAVSMLCGARPAYVESSIRTFPGVCHRLELVRVHEGVRYYNDSIATAPDRTIAALQTIPGPVVLIAGGYDKGISFQGLAREIASKARALVLTGDTSQSILREVTAVLSQAQPGDAERALAPDSIHLAPTFEAAVKKASAIALPGDAVLMSPACASFDMFVNFEERGDTFRRLVNSW